MSATGQSWEAGLEAASWWCVHATPAECFLVRRQGHVSNRAKLRGRAGSCRLVMCPCHPSRMFSSEKTSTCSCSNLSISLCFPTISCAQRSLFCRFHGISSLSISPVVSPTTEFTQPPPSLLELESMPLKILCSLHFRQLISFPLIPQVTLLEQHYFDIVPLAAIRIKSAPGCL